MMPLDERDVSFAATLSKSDIPRKLRCVFCKQLALNAMKLLCCGISLCGTCYLKPHCICLTFNQSPASCALHKVDKALRSLTVAFITTTRMIRDADAGGESSGPLKRTRSQMRAQQLLMQHEVAPFQPFRFFDLPVELQDIILDFAYPRQPDTKYIHPTQWQRRERDRRRAHPLTYQVLAFPLVKVAEFVVSKAYFGAAARAWTSNQLFDFSHGGVCYTIGKVGSFTHAYLTNFKTTLWSQQRFHLFAHLRHLELTVEVSTFDVDSFEAIKPKFVWLDILDEEEFVTSMQVNGLHQHPGLRVLKLIAGTCTWAKLACELQMWQANVQRLETVVKRTALLPKATPTKTSERTEMLYPGSSVYFASRPSTGATQVGQDLPLQQTLTTRCPGETNRLPMTKGAPMTQLAASSKDDSQQSRSTQKNEDHQALTVLSKVEQGREKVPATSIAITDCIEGKKGEEKAGSTAQSIKTSLQVSREQLQAESLREMPIHSRTTQESKGDSIDRLMQQFKEVTERRTQARKEIERENELKELVRERSERESEQARKKVEREKRQNERVRGRIERQNELRTREKIERETEQAREKTEREEREDEQAQQQSAVSYVPPAQRGAAKKIKRTRLGRGFVTIAPKLEEHLDEAGSSAR